MEISITDRSVGRFFLAAFVGILILAAVTFSLADLIIVRSSKAAHLQYLVLLQEMRENQKLLKEMVEVQYKVSEITLDLMRSKSESNSRQLEDILRTLRADRKEKEKSNMTSDQKILTERKNGNGNNGNNAKP